MTLVCVVLLAGCGGGGQSPVSRAQATHEYPFSQPPRQRVAGASSDAVQAIRKFANTYINWDADTVSGQMRQLAARSVGQARSAMELAAGQTARDYELRRGGISNTGTVEAVAPLLDRRDQFVVVTREQTIATNSDAYRGLRPAWHVAIAAVIRISRGNGDGWAVSRWQPEN